MMRIIDKPSKEHNTSEDTTKHISKTRQGYTIRKTINGQTYYYGCYNTITEAQQVEQQLQRHKYTPRLSTQYNTRRGQEYNKWLQEKLQQQE